MYATLITVVIVYAWSVRRSETFSASFLLSVGRLASQDTADYRYDQFYRFQADEKFAETIVQWLSSPGVSKSILDKAEVKSDGKTIRQLSKSFRSEKISSSLVGVRYGTQSEDEGKKLAVAISSLVLDKTKNMNSEARDPDWFSVDMANLIVAKNTQDLRINLGLAALFGIFIGSLLAFGKHYISDETEK